MGRGGSMVCTGWALSSSEVQRFFTKTVNPGDVLVRVDGKSVWEMERQEAPHWL